MASCEKCWSEAHRDPYKSVADEYARLIEEHKANGTMCTPEEQAGPDATECPGCRRMTLHQLCRICMVCGRDYGERIRAPIGEGT